MKELLETSRKIVTYFGKAKFEVTGSELMGIAIDLQKFSQLIVQQEKIISEEIKIKEEKNGMQKKEPNKKEIINKAE